MTAINYPIPKNWQSFEELVLDLYKEIYNDSFKKHGRNGQDQNGVDIYGKLDDGSWCGIQCKKYSARKFTKKELIAEVNKAKEFTPSLKRYIIATTNDSDKSIQEQTRILTDKHNAEGLFSVDVISWTDLESYLLKYKSVSAKYYPNIHPQKQYAVSIEISDIVHKSHDKSRDYISKISDIDRTKNLDKLFHAFNLKDKYEFSLVIENIGDLTIKSLTIELDPEEFYAVANNNCIRYSIESLRTPIKYNKEIHPGQKEEILRFHLSCKPDKINTIELPLRWKALIIDSKPISGSLNITKIIATSPLKKIFYDIPEEIMIND